MIFATVSAVEKPEEDQQLLVYAEQRAGVSGPVVQWRQTHVQRLEHYKVVDAIDESAWHGPEIDGM